ncbi:MAG: DUF4358 domain-containing protein [Clostridia bacterium]|nr:DUF4358 domain-containing protein [Clostridia bacterium]
MKIRSVIALIMAMLLVVCAFTGCNKEPVTEENTTEAPVSEVVTEEPSAELTTEKEITTKAETTTEKETTTKAETTTKKPETTTKAETTTKKSSVDVNSIAATIAGKTSMFEETLFQSSGAIGLDIFGIPSSAVSEVAYYVASAAVAEEVLVVKAASSADVATIKSCIEARRSMQAEDYADYVPKEVPKLNSAITYTSGDVIVFCVSNNNSAMRSVISGLL